MLKKVGQIQNICEEIQIKRQLGIFLNKVNFWKNVDMWLLHLHNKEIRDSNFAPSAAPRLIHWKFMSKAILLRHGIVHNTKSTYLQYTALR